MKNNKKIKLSKLITINELAIKLELVNKKTKRASTHTLRFWEKKFKQIKPTILSGNRRYYSNKDVELIEFINYLLKKQRLTIEGVKNVLNNKINKLDDYKSYSVKEQYYKKLIKDKSKKILTKIKKLNG
jgi:DNA-binding transcriptional MerR regulator